MVLARPLGRLFALLVILAFAAPRAGAQCSPTWLESDGLPGLDAECDALVGADLGEGPRLFAGGAFTVAGGAPASRVAQFDGVRWAPMGAGAGAGLDNAVNALAVYNGQLIAGGAFTADSAGAAALRVARWDGAAWVPMGAGFSHPVNALAVVGGELYAGGDFTASGASPVAHIARWNGSAWVAVGAGLNGSVNALGEYAGSLYAGGIFTASGAASMTDIARFDGSAWQPVGAVAPLTGGSSFRGVRAMTVHNDELVVAGGFTQLNGAACSFAARWNGAAWTAMPCPSGGATNAAFAVKSAGGVLYIGGAISFSGGVHTARWTGSAWQSLGGAYDTPSYVYALEPFQNRLIIGGTFTAVGSISNLRITSYDAGAFQPLTRGLNGVIYALRQFGGDLYTAGAFTNADGRIALKAARLENGRLVPLAAQLPSGGEADCLEVHNNELYIAGFWGAGNAQHLARWTGSAWSAVSAPISPVAVGAMRTFGGSLVVGAVYSNGLANVARWDGANWIAMGAGLNGVVQDLHIHQGSLYAAGRFTASGAASMNLIARWDGANWQPVGSGAGTGAAGSRYGLTTWNDQLILGGTFSSIGGVAVNGLAKWNGSSWSAIPGLAANAGVTAVGTFGPSLVVVGSVNVAGQPAPNSVAIYNGADWSALGQGFSGRTLGGTTGPTFYAMDEMNNELFVGGDFFRAGGRVSAFLAHWGSESPCIQSSPSDVLACRGSTVTLRCLATGLPTLSYQWRRNQQPIADGPAPGGSAYSGTTTAVLEIAGLLDGDAGSYDLVVTNGLGSMTSDPATVAVCPADYNCDGFVDFFDYGDYVTAFETGVGDADFNLDGFVDFFDYGDFVSAFEVGC